MTQSEKTASEVLDLALADPTDTVRQATNLLDESPSESDKATLLRARGLAHRILGDLDASAADLELGVAVAEAAGAVQVRIGVSLTLAGTHVFQGNTEVALDVLHEAVDEATGELKAEVLFQLGTTYAQAGNLDEAVTVYARALPLIRRHGRRDWESNLLGNRGIMHFHRGDYKASIRDLDQAIALQHELNIPAQAAINMVNKAQALFMSGDMAASLDLYREAELMQNALGMPVLMHANKCETYLAAGLFEACLDLARVSHQFHRQGQLAIGQIRSLMPGAEAALALHRNDLAVELALAVHQVHGAENFPVWLARADLIRLEALALKSEADRADIKVALDLQRDAARGDTGTSARAGLVAAQISLRLGEVDPALALLDGLASLSQKAPLHLQIYRWTLLAEARSRAGNHRGTLSAVRAGLRAFDHILVGVTSFDVRARASRHATALTATGVDQLMQRKRLDDAVNLVERLRSGAIRVPELSVADAQELIAAEARHRRGEDLDASELLRLQNRVSEPAPGHQVVKATLADDESLVTWVEVAGDLLCIHRTNRKTTSHRCGSVRAIQELVDEHEFLHRQLARQRQLSERALVDIRRRQNKADRRLSELLLPPNLAGRVVLNPPADLSGLCWGSLPELHDRPHVVAASLHLAQQPLGNELRRAVVLGSSDLAHVHVEIAGVALSYKTAPGGSGRARVMRSLNGIDVLHLAGHFVSEGSDPLLSGVALDGFTLRGSDMLEVRRPPRVVVLSACASGTTEQIGGAAIGFATAALSAGTVCVIAAQTLIEDGGDIVETMTELHRLLAAGCRPGDALRQLRSDERVNSPAARSLVAVGTAW